MIDAKMVLWDFVVSLWRVFAGVALAIVVALLLTWIRANLGRKWRENALIRFLFEAPKFPPPIAWIPLVVLLAGIGELAAILIVMIGALAPLFTGLYDGFIHYKDQ